MKKILMTVVAAFAAVSMNAQVYVGGTLGLSFENKLVNVKDGSEATGMNFQIKPEVGFNLDEKSSVGVVLGFGITNNTNEMFERNTFAAEIAGGLKTDKSAIQFAIAPYYRYKFLQFDKVDLFFDAQVGFTYTKFDELKNTTFNVGVRPGVAFNASDNISFVAKLGTGLFFESSKNKGQDARSKFGLNANTLAPLEIGMYYNL